MNWSKRGAAYGAIGGAVVGAGLGYLAGQGTKNVGTQTVAGTLIVGLIGAAGGAFVPPLMSSGQQASSNTPTPSTGAGAPYMARTRDHLMQLPEHQWALTPTGQRVFRRGNMLFVNGVWHQIA
jgi:hypothetical protein